MEVVLLEAVAPGFVPVAGRWLWRMLAGEEGARGPFRPGQLDTKWPSSLQRKQRGGLRFHLMAGRAGRMAAPHRNPGRCGERERQAVAEWLQRLL